MVHLSSPSAFSPHFLFTVRSNQRNRTSFTADCGESCRLTAGGATSGTSKRSKNGFQFSSKRLQTETNGPTVYPKTSFQDHEVIWLTTSRAVTVMTVDKCVHQSEGCSLLKKNMFRWWLSVISNKTRTSLSFLMFFIQSDHLEIEEQSAASLWL